MPSFFELPDEILTGIYSYLKKEDLFNTMLVSIKSLSISNDKSVWLANLAALSNYVNKNEHPKVTIKKIFYAMKESGEELFHKALQNENFASLIIKTKILKDKVLPKNYFILGQKYSSMAISIINDPKIPYLLPGNLAHMCKEHLDATLHLLKHSSHSRRLDIYELQILAEKHTEAAKIILETPWLKGKLKTNHIEEIERLLHVSSVNNSI
jgi:hypothetical protein